jgi:drug/metabolite transporter (DMT)-like permease
MRVRQTGRIYAGLYPALGLLLLSALWSVESLRADQFPGSNGDALSPVQGQAVLFSIFAAVAASVALARRVEFPRGRSAWACACIAIGLFVAPAALVACAKDWVSTLDRVAVFSLTPVFAVVLERYFEGGVPRQAKAALPAAVTGVAGVLCVLGFDIPGSIRAGIALCALVGTALGIAATNCFAVRLARSVGHHSILPMAAQAGGTSAICFVAFAAFAPHVARRWSALPLQLLWSLAIDLAALFLLFSLMRRLNASRMTAPFLLAPMFTIVAGVALEPASPPAVAWLGIALLAGGAGWLVFAPSEEVEVAELGLLNTSRRLPPSE